VKSRLQFLPICDLAKLRPFYKKARCAQLDSRLVKSGDLFFAFPGHVFDGRDYIADAIKQGTSAIFWEPSTSFCWDKNWQCPNVPVEQLAQHAGVIMADMLGYPSCGIPIIGVTGTNGKTSIVYWLAKAYQVLNKKIAAIGTVGNGFLNQLSLSTHTTPDALTNQQLLVQYCQQGADGIVMEVSSHGLDQGRVNGVSFKTAIFTNLTRDHLDYHCTMSAYGEAKRLLFYWEGLQNVIINLDDPFGAKLAQELKNQPVNLLTYGFNQGDIQATSLNISRDGLLMNVKTPRGSILLNNTQLIGRFNGSNLLACLATLMVNDVPLQDAANALAKIEPVSGRMQRLNQPNKPLVVIDYAHTPDALEKTLIALADIRSKKSKLYCVFGCGGERDKGKRSLMGSVAEKIADVVVVTSDNPRTEDPLTIVHDILVGVSQPVHVDIDRLQAIFWAIRRATAKDIVLIAGKGHEQYQDINGKKISFSDYQIAQDALLVNQS
jgi:UDP-N-acetylmuramoyl-L-alanyl-D-glutamate--2,6-diaminopimelate ligase